MIYRTTELYIYSLQDEYEAARDFEDSLIEINSQYIKNVDDKFIYITIKKRGEIKPIKK